MEAPRWADSRDSVSFWRLGGLSIALFWWISDPVLGAWCWILYKPPVRGSFFHGPDIPLVTYFVSREI